MRRAAGLILAASLAFAAWALPADVRAQQPIRLATLQIALWPEFDKPSVLVILDGKLDPALALPADLQVRMPAAAGAPNAVAVAGSDGGLLQAPYTTTLAGGDIIIKFTTRVPGFRVEYYDPALSINGEARSYSFRWTSDYAIAALSVLVQEPVGAHGLSTQPALTAAGAGEYGLNYYAAALGSVAPDGVVALSLSYAKTGNGLSIAALGGTPAAPAGSAVGTDTRLPWLAGGAAAGLALVAGGLFWKRAARGARPRRRKAGGASGVPAVRKTGGTLRQAEPASFCTQCGQRQLPGDRYCRNCGSAVRE